MMVGDVRMYSFMILYLCPKSRSLVQTYWSHMVPALCIIFAPFENFFGNELVILFGVTLIYDSYDLLFR